MFLSTDLWTVERCRSLSHTGQKPFLHLRTLTEQTSASLVCMFKSTGPTALSPTRGKDITILETLFYQVLSFFSLPENCISPFCDVLIFPLSPTQASIHLLPGQCALFPASRSKNSSLPRSPHRLLGICQEVGVSAAAQRNLFWSWSSLLKSVNKLCLLSLVCPPQLHHRAHLGLPTKWRGRLHLPLSPCRSKDPKA